MAKYTYKGQNIENLIVAGSTDVTNYNGLTYAAAANPNYTTERPLPFSITQQGIDISTIMDAKYVEFTTGSGTYSIPSDFNGFRAVLEGGGGGSGGAGGGGNGPLVGQQKNGGGGAGGLNGGFIYVSDVLLNSPIQISYTVGGGGGGGADGASISPSTAVGKGTPGNAGGTGGSTNISFQTYSITAGGGGGGDYGNGGTSTGNSGNIADSGNASIASSSNYNPSAIVIVDTNNPIPSNVNPLGYLVNRSLGGPTAGGPASGGGKPGYIRIYLLRD
jgi:hypothetical protein